MLLTLVVVTYLAIPALFPALVLAKKVFKGDVI